MRGLLVLGRGSVVVIVFGVGRRWLRHEVLMGVNRCRMLVGRTCLCLFDGRVLILVIVLQRGDRGYFRSLDLSSLLMLMRISWVNWQRENGGFEVRRISWVHSSRGQVWIVILWCS